MIVGKVEVLEAAAARRHNIELLQLRHGEVLGAERVRQDLVEVEVGRGPTAVPVLDPLELDPELAGYLHR